MRADLWAGENRLAPKRWAPAASLAGFEDAAPPRDKIPGFPPRKNLMNSRVERPHSPPHDDGTFDNNPSNRDFRSDGKSAAGMRVGGLSTPGLAFHLLNAHRKMLPFLWIIRGEDARATWQSEISGTVASRGLCTGKNLATGISAQKQPLLRYAALHTYFLTDTIDEPLSHRRNLRSS